MQQTYSEQTFTYLVTCKRECECTNPMYAHTHAHHAHLVDTALVKLESVAADKRGVERHLQHLLLVLLVAVHSVSRYVSRAACRILHIA